MSNLKLSKVVANELIIDGKSIKDELGNFVKSVNGITPDVNGNIQIELPEPPHLNALDYTAFEVYPTSEDIPAGTTSDIKLVDGDIPSGLIDSTYFEQKEDGYYYKYVNLVPACQVQCLRIRSSVIKSECDVVIDWGDGTVESIKDLENTVDSESKLDKTSSGFYYSPTNENDDYESEFICLHKYEVPDQKYIIKIYGNKYWGIRTKSFHSQNLICRMMDIDLPMNPCCVNISYLCKNDLRLLRLKLPAYYPSIFRFENVSYAFGDCRNLITVKGFEKYAWNGTVRTSECMFTNCSNLLSTDIKVPLNVTNSGKRIYEGCTSLSFDISTMIQGSVGYYGTNFQQIFYNCKNVTCSDYSKLASLLWNSPFGSTWVGTSAFKGCSKLDLSQIPSSWGGSL